MVDAVLVKNRARHIYWRWLIFVDGCRSDLHVLDRKQATFVHQPSRTSERNESIYFLRLWEAFLHHKKACTHSWQWHIALQRPLVGATEEDCCARILHGQGQGKYDINFNSFFHTDVRYLLYLVVSFVNTFPRTLILVCFTCQQKCREWWDWWWNRPNR